MHASVKNKVWHYTVLLSHKVTRDIHTRQPNTTDKRQDRELNRYFEQPWVVCTLPERAFVRFDILKLAEILF